MFFGVFIRYILLGSLKIQITICSSLAVGYIVEESVTKPRPTTTLIIIGIIVILILWLCPLVFGIILYKNQKTLNELETKEKFGSLYEFHDAKRPYVATYVVVYLMRRSTFVGVTFLMFYHTDF